MSGMPHGFTANAQQTSTQGDLKITFQFYTWIVDAYFSSLFNKYYFS
jgi:hypothetical protein